MIAAGLACTDRRSPTTDAAAPLAADAVFQLLDSVPLATREDDPLGDVSAVTSWGDTYAIADAYQRNVKVFDRQGRLRSTIGRVGDGPGEFRSPVSLAVLRTGELAVVDDGRANLTTFGTNGELRSTVRLPGLGHGTMSMLPDGEQYVMPLTLRSDSSYSFDALYVLDLHGNVRDRVATAEPPSRIMQGNINYLQAAVVGSTVVWAPMRGNEAHFMQLRDGSETRARVGAAVYREPQWPERPLGAGERGLQWMRAQMWTAAITPLDSAHVLFRFSTGGSGRRGLNEHYYVIRRLGADGETIVGPTPIHLHSCHDGTCTSVTLDDEGTAHLRTYRVALPRR